jgi:hypothetical protein
MVTLLSNAQSYCEIARWMFETTEEDDEEVVADKGEPRRNRARMLLDFVEYLLLLRGWCASLPPPTICAKSYKAYNVSTCYYRIKQQNGMSLVASPNAIYLPYTLLR